MFFLKVLSDLSEALNKTTRPILTGKISATSTLVNDLASITSSLKPVAIAAATTNDKNNNNNSSKTNQDIDKIKSIIKLEEKFKKNIDLFQKEINSCQHLEAISMEFISNENVGQKNHQQQQQQQPSTSTKITKTKTSTNNSTKTTTTTTTTITKNSSLVDSKGTTVNKNGKINNVTSTNKSVNEKALEEESSSSVKKLRSSSSSSSSNVNNAKMSTSPVKILKELAKSKDKKYSEVKRMIEDEKLAKELAIKLKEADSDEYEDDDEDDEDLEHDSDEDDDETEEDDDDEDDEDEEDEYSQEFQNMSYNDHLITIIMKPPKGNQSLEDKMNSIHRNALKSKAIASATSKMSSSNVKYKDRVKTISLANEEEERIESTLSSLSLHGHLTNRKPSVEEILKTINSNDENIIFVQPFSENNNSKALSTEAVSTTANTANINQQQRKTYRRKPVMQCTNVHCISSGSASCSSSGSSTTTTTTSSTTTSSNNATSRNKDVLIESNTVIRLNSSPSQSGIVDLRDEKNASQLAFLLNLKNESQKSSVYNRLKAQAAKPLQKLNGNSNETNASSKNTSNAKHAASVKGMIFK